MGNRNDRLYPAPPPHAPGWHAGSDAAWLSGSSRLPAASLGLLAIAALVYVVRQRAGKGKGAPSLQEVTIGGVMAVGTAAAVGATNLKRAASARKPYEGGLGTATAGRPPLISPESSFDRIETRLGVLELVDTLQPEDDAGVFGLASRSALCGGDEGEVRPAQGRKGTKVPTSCHSAAAALPARHSLARRPFARAGARALSWHDDEIHGMLEDEVEVLDDYSYGESAANELIE